MMNVLLIIHLIITVSLVGMVLMQRSEGGALGIGGGGGSGGGFMTTRGTANAMTRMTVGLAAAFFVTSISLSILAGVNRGGTGSVLDGALPEENELINFPTEEPAPADDGLPEVPVGD